MKVLWPTAAKKGESVVQGGKGEDVEGFMAERHQQEEAKRCRTMSKRQHKPHIIGKGWWWWWGDTDSAAIEEGK